MSSTPALPTSNFLHALPESYLLNDQMNQIILEHLHPDAWRAKPPGRHGRTIAAIFTHMHNIRRKWIRLSAPHLRLPAQLDRARCTQRQAKLALADSALLCADMLSEAFNSDGRIKQFHRDGWAKPWPICPAMLAYMITHDAHHRGQACMLAHQLGFPLPSSVMSEMWAWERLWKKCGLKGLQNTP